MKNCNLKLVGLRTAKLAKEKGFNIPVFDCINENEEIGDRDQDCIPVNFNKFPTVQGSTQNLYSAPTQYELQDWLRINHKLHIETQYYYGWRGKVVNISTSNPKIVWGSEMYDDFHKFIEQALLQSLISIIV